MPDHWLQGQTGSDSNAYNVNLVLVIAQGSFPWIVNLRSYFAMYPFTVESGIFASGASLLLALDLEFQYIILILSLFFGIIGTMGSFLVGREIFRDNFIAIMIGLSYSVQYYFLSHSMWRYSQRGAFMAFMPFFFWCFLRCIKSHNNRTRFAVLLVLTYFILQALHGMVAYVIPTVILPICFVILIYKCYYLIKKKNLIVYQYRNRGTKIVYSSILIFYSIIFLLMISYTDFLISLGFPVQELWIKSDYDYPYLIGRLMNIGKTYTVQGILQFLSVVGVLSLFQRDFKSIVHNVIIAILGVQLLFALDFEYFMPVFVITLSVLVGYGLQLLLPIVREKNKIYHLTLIFLLITPVGYAYFLKDLNTHVQVTRDFHPDLQDNRYTSVPGEAWNSAFWRTEYIPSEKMILNNPPGHLHIGLTSAIQTLEDEYLIWNWREGQLQNIVVVQEYSFYRVFFHQRDGHLAGGKVQDWYGTSDDIYPDMHEFYIINKFFNYRQLINNYEINYAVHWHHPNVDDEGGNNTKYPIFKDIYDENYKVYSNELYTFFFYLDDY